MCTFKLFLFLIIAFDSCSGLFWFEDSAFVEKILTTNVTNFQNLEDLLAAIKIGNRTKSYLPVVRFDTFGFKETLRSPNVYLVLKLSDKLFKLSSKLCPMANNILIRIMQDISAYTYIRKLQLNEYMDSSDYINYGIKMAIKHLEQCEMNPPQGDKESFWLFEELENKTGNDDLQALKDLTKCSDIRMWFDSNEQGKSVTVPGRIAFENLWGSYLPTYFACSSTKKPGDQSWRYYDLIESVMLSPFLPIWSDPDLPLRRALHVFKVLDEFQSINTSSDNYSKLSACASQMFFRTNTFPYPCFAPQSDKLKRINISRALLLANERYKAKYNTTQSEKLSKPVELWTGNIQSTTAFTNQVSDINATDSLNEIPQQS